VKDADGQWCLQQLQTDDEEVEDLEPVVEIESETSPADVELTAETQEPSMLTGAVDSTELADEEQGELESASIPCWQGEVGTPIYNGAACVKEADGQSFQPQPQTSGVNTGGLKRRIRIKGKARPALAAEEQTPLTPTDAGEAERQGESETIAGDGSACADGVDAQSQLLTNGMSTGGLKRRIRIKGKTRSAGTVLTAETKTPLTPISATGAERDTSQKSSPPNRYLQQR
jgi:hypothetical protein